MSDSFTEVTQQSWLGRLGESIKGVLVGLVLFIAAFPVLWMNEGCSARQEAALYELKGKVKSVSADKVDPQYDGQPVHMTAKATTDATLEDPQFGVSADQVIKLRRTVQMYQWEEDTQEEERKKLGGGTETVTTYTYEQAWSEDLIDSGSFKKPEGHQNPDQMPVQSETQTAMRVQFGAYHLSPGLISGLSDFEPLPVEGAPPGPAESSTEEATDAPQPEETSGNGDAAAEEPADDPATGDDAEADPNPSGGPTASDSGPLADRMWHPYEGGYYIGSDPGNPQIGDLKVAFAVVKPTMASVIAKQNGDTFEPWRAKNGNPVERLMVGQLSAEAMISQMLSENAMFTWIMRLVGFLMMTFGIAMVFKPLVVVADVVPIFGDLLQGGVLLFSGVVAAALSLITIGIAWVFYRPLWGIGLIVVAVLLVVGAKMLLGRGKQAKEA